MICKFCGGDFPKLAKAHIIPRTFYEEVRGKDNYSIFFKASASGNRREFKQNGIYDDSILCSACDNKFSLADKHGREVFVRALKEKNIYRDPEGISCAYFLPDVNYDLLKRFVLSLVWRASITTHPFFAGVDIGPHEGRIKTLLENNSSGTIDEYSFFVYHLINNPRPDTITPPEPLKFGNYKSLFMYLPSISIMVKLDKRPFSDYMKKNIIIKPDAPHYMLFQPYQGSFEQIAWDGIRPTARAGRIADEARKALKSNRR